TGERKLGEMDAHSSALPSLLSFKGEGQGEGSDFRPDKYRTYQHVRKLRRGREDYFQIEQGNGCGIDCAPVARSRGDARAGQERRFVVLTGRFSESRIQVQSGKHRLR